MKRGSPEFEPPVWPFFSLSTPKGLHLTEQLESAIRAFANKCFHSKDNPQAFDALKSVSNQFSGLIILTPFHLIDLC